MATRAAVTVADEASVRPLERALIPLRTRLLFVAFGPAVVLLVTAIFVYSTLQQSIAATADVVRTRNGIIQMNVLLASVVGQESAVRGFVITEDESYLDPYRVGEAEFARIAASVRPAIADAPAQLDRLERIAALHDRWQRDIATVEIELARAGRSDQALEVIRSKAGKLIMDEIRLLTSAMVDDAWSVLEARRAVRDQASLDAQTAVLLGPLLAAVVMLLITFLVARRVAGDVGAVAEAARGFARGDLSRRAEVRSQDETGILATSFNAMAERIGAQVQREQDVSERLRTQATELEEVNAELESFSYSVSHDLRAPLRAIDGFSQILLEDHAAVLDDEGRRLLARIRSASQRMGGLIDDILQLSRVSRSPVVRQPVDLGRLASDIVDELRRAEPDRRVDVQLETDLSTWADPMLARMVMDNLLSNAWKFTAGKERPTIRIGRVGPDTFSVSDDGAGFDMAYADKLFQPFQRLHLADEFPGTGIGLATVQRVLRRHGGSARAKAEPGVGATFWFSFSDPVASEESS
jgi:signal transduction histidine kinase